MTFPVTRRFFLSGLASTALAGAAVAGAPTTSLRPVMRGDDLRRRALGTPDRVISGAGLSGAAAFAVADVGTGKVLEAFHGEMALPPASVTKTITTLYALDVLGPDHRFVTRLLTTGPLTDGILKGDLILDGGGDPLLDTVALAQMARSLRESGLKEVRGKFIVHDGALPLVPSIDPEQPDHVGYNPTISGIALNFNRVHFEWKRVSGKYTVTMDARAEGYRPDVVMARMSVINRQLPVYTYEDRDGKDNWTVASQALGNGGARWLPVRKPAAYAGDVFRTLARANGIVLPKVRVSRTRPGGTTERVRHASAPLREILHGMMKYSNNLTAEMVGLSATRARGIQAATLKDSAAEMSRWAADRHGMSHSSFVDHSGLGDQSRMTPNDLVAALVEVRKSGILRPLMKPIALRDRQGRVRKDHPIKVNAKTGTLNFVSGLGGFMTAADGTELAFVILSADTKTRASIARADREVPPGAREWNRKAKKLQQALIERWGQLYGS